MVKLTSLCLLLSISKGEDKNAIYQALKSILGLKKINMLAIFLKPLILRARCARKIKGFRKMAKVLIKTTRF